MSLNLDGSLALDALAHSNQPDRQAPCSCYHCGGYYGPANGDPLCEICHDFLYVEEFDISQQNWGFLAQTEAKKDDGDSGNDEPSDDAPPIPPVSFRRDPPVIGNALPVDFPDATPPLAAAAARQSSSNPRDTQSAPAARSESDSYNNLDVDSSSLDEMFNGPLLPNSAESREHERVTRRVNLLTTPLPTYQKVPEVDLTTKLPPEIWSIIFQKLDPISLLFASRARLRWKSIILELVPNDTWKSFVMERWPLFSPIYDVMDWYSVFVAFAESLSCCACWIKMSVSPVLLPPVGDEVPFRSLRSVRLSKELKWLTSDHPDGIEAVPLDHLNYNWVARIIGPPQSPYQGGVFYLNIKIPHDYPLKPPLVRFLTKVYHPNISRHGDIGIDSLGPNWTLGLFIPQTLLSIQSLLTDPCEPWMESAIGRLRIEDPKGFEREARNWTWKYAMTDVLLM